jgi:hypothetical protein
MAKTAKVVQDATGASFSTWFGDDTANGFTQKMNISDESGNPNSITNPLFQQSTGIYYSTPTLLQYTTNIISGTPYAPVGTIDMNLQPALQIGTSYNGAHTYTITQYQDAGATLLQGNTIVLSSALVLSVHTIRQNVQITWNYIKISIAASSGTIAGTTYWSIGILPVSPDSLGQKASSDSLPVVLSNDYEITGKVLRTSPVIATPATRNPSRLNQFFEPIVQPAGQQQFALENTYWVAPINPTIGTAIALGTATQTAYVGTAPSILVRNAATALGKDIILHSIELSMITTGTLMTDMWIEVHIDTTNRYTSGGSAITGKTLYSQSATTAFTAFNASTAIVATADTATYTRLFRRRIRTAIPVAGDIYKIAFDGQYDSGSYALNSSVASVYNVHSPICVIPPVGTALIYIYGTGMTVAPTYEGVIEFTER